MDQWLDTKRTGHVVVDCSVHDTPTRLLYRFPSLCPNLDVLTKETMRLLLVLRSFDTQDRRSYNRGLLLSQRRTIYIYRQPYTD